jgi:hypothetical protein
MFKGLEIKIQELEGSKRKIFQMMNSSICAFLERPLFGNYQAL